MAPEIQVISRPWTEWSAASTEWRELERQCEASFFVSTDWIATWISVFGEQFRPEILTFRQGDQIAGACLLTPRVIRRKGVPVRRIYLNCGGEDEADETFVEYNRLLTLPGLEREVGRSLHKYLGRQSWDEFVGQGLESRDGLEEVVQGAFRVETLARPCVFVDLDELRRTGKPYESTLSSNTKQQIRRSIRLYEESSGGLKIERASNDAQAVAYFDEMARLHQRSWTDRGEPGAFASPKFRMFHERLLKAMRQDGGAQLLRVTAGEQVLGILYNFEYRGRVYFYQSGIEYHEDKRLKPGLVSHFIAINQYLNDRPDVLEYDFLAGESQYKRSLGKNERTLEWMTVQRGTVRLRMLNVLRDLRGRSVTAATIG